MRRSILIILFLASLFTCRDSKLEQLDFFTVTFEEVKAGHQLGSLILKGRVDYLNDVTIIDNYGFLWSTSGDNLNGLEKGAHILSPELLENSGYFRDSLSALTPDSIYYFQAFAQAGERIVFSAIEAFAFNFSLQTDSLMRRNNEAIVVGRIFGLDRLESNVKQFGHVFSQTNPMPEYDGLNVTHLAEGELDDDILFLDTIGSLHFNTTYYIRSYVKADAIYYSAPITFRIRDGWEKVNDFGLELEFVTGAAIEAQHRAYVMLGCTAYEECDLGSISDKFWSFDPTAEEGLGSWNSQVVPDSTVYGRFDAISFAISEIFYLGFGKVPNADKPTRDLFAMELPGSGGWQNLTQMTHEFNVPRLRSGIAFVLNGKAYVGTGASIENSAEVLLNEFWEFDPSEEAWRKVAGLPLKTNAQANITYEGRSGASAFSFESYAIVGGGQKGALVLNDFWKFTPPQSVQDTGRWEFHSFFPGNTRKDAVSFTIDGKGYYGTGEDNINSLLSDFWELAPEASSRPWSRKTDFQGAARSNAVGFAIGGKGYVGTGNGKIVIGTNVELSPQKDFWRYHPDKD